MSKVADVIVIGSGIIGSSTAYELAKQGKKVIVLENTEMIGRRRFQQKWSRSPA